MQQPSDPRFESITRRILDLSAKGSAAFQEALHEVRPLLGPEDLCLWGEIGAVILEVSSVAAVRYFSESPEIFKTTQRSTRTRNDLDVFLHLARQDYGIALEAFRLYPGIIMVAKPAEMLPWAQIGLDLAREDYTAAVEYVKAGPEILGTLDVSDIASWAMLGLLIFSKERETKTLRAFEYFRLSPGVLQQLAERSIRSRVVTLAARMEERSPAPSAAMAPGTLVTPAMDVINAAVQSLSAWDSPEEQAVVLDLAITMAQESPGAVLPYLRSIPEAYRLTGKAIVRFKDWTEQGIRLARKDREKGAAYFSMEMSISRQSLERLTQAVYLKDISRTLKFYAEGLCGRAIEIRSVAASESMMPTTPAGIISLPERIEVFPRLEDNLRFYRVRTMHEAGHLEFGTYEFLNTNTLTDPREFENPVLSNILWTIVEEGRIDFLLKHAYPGIQGDLDFVVAHQLRHRNDLFRLPPHQGVLEALMRLSITETVEVPVTLLEVVSAGYEILKRVLRPGATVKDSMDTTIALYSYLEPHLAHIQFEPAPEGSTTTEKIDPLSSHSPPSPFAYRGPLREMPVIPLQESAPSGSEMTTPRPHQKMAVESHVTDGAEIIKDEESTTLVSSRQSPAAANEFLYDEWDNSLKDYRRHWCRLEERSVPLGVGTLDLRLWQTEHAGEIVTLRRYFETLRPEAYRKLKHQVDGDELEIDSVIASVASRRGGGDPGDRLYSRREKKGRDVSAAFLIDLSGSTRRLVAMDRRGEIAERRVIDIEKEGLLMLSEAIDAIGDEYALYGYSGQSRDQIDFYRIKGFDEIYGMEVRQRIAALEPQGQNRDGTAIRHTLRILRQRPTKTRLLVLISDGRPLDKGYSSGYAQADTRMALQEARACGVHPFCITVDQEAPEYIESMYQEVQYLVLNDIRTLPQKLPRIYKRLTF